MLCLLFCVPLLLFIPFYSTYGCRVSGSTGTGSEDDMINFHAACTIVYRMKNQKQKMPKLIGPER